MRFDVVSICFRDELPLLALQSRSIDVFWDLDMIENYMIIINDPESADECRDYITRRILPSMSSRLRAVTRVVTADDLIGQVMPGRGWKTQQALKLAVARALESPFYLALDARITSSSRSPVRTSLTPTSLRTRPNVCTRRTRASATG